MALEKNVYLTETMHFQLRIETFNTFYHTNFRTPVNDLSAPNFGEVNSVQQISTSGAGE